MLLIPWDEVRVIAGITTVAVDVHSDNNRKPKRAAGVPRSLRR